MYYNVLLIVLFGTNINFIGFTFLLLGIHSIQSAVPANMSGSNMQVNNKNLTIYYSSRAFKNTFICMRIFFSLRRSDRMRGKK